MKRIWQKEEKIYKRPEKFTGRSKEEKDLNVNTGRRNTKKMKKKEHENKKEHVLQDQKVAFNAFWNNKQYLVL